MTPPGWADALNNMGPGGEYMRHRATMNLKELGLEHCQHCGKFFSRGDMAAHFPDNPWCMIAETHGQ